MSNETHLTLSWDKDQIRNKPKNQVFNLFMLSGLTRIYVNTQKLDLKIPEELKQIPTIVLELGYEMAKPISDLTVSEFCLEATLSFASGWFTCVIPWDSVVAITTADNLGVFYNADPNKIEVEDKIQKRAKFTVLQGGKN